jgi:pyruvate carboxylase
MRTADMLAIAPVYARYAAQLFSLEMWGGATFDTALRFLKECPWQRLADMRSQVPNILFQMLYRSSNAVGYTSYPDNVVEEFVEEAVQAGMDVFRIFDSLNYLPNLEVAMDAVLKHGGLCEPAICYTGDILDPRRTKYDLKYYVNMARELERRGAHILAIKDMAGLCKPYAAERLVKTLRQEVGLPIHFHTHDTAGIQAGAYAKGAEQQVDIVDAAMAALSGGTSQPNLNTLAESLRFTERDTLLDATRLTEISEYWRNVREFYAPFESPSLSAAADLYDHEMPGGQYTNLYQQARSLGLADRWPEVCQMYAEVNRLFGDIVKVTPSSKAVGDMALFMVNNNLTAADILNPQRELSFPESVVDLISGMMGQPPGGFPPEVQRRILKGKPPVEGRPGASLAPADFAKATREVHDMLGSEPEKRDVISYLLYPRVYADYARHLLAHADTSVLSTPVFFYGMETGEETSIEIEPGKTLIVKYVTTGIPHEDGRRTVFFELNGQPRDVTVLDRTLEAASLARSVKADPTDKHQIGAGMPGMVVSVAVKGGDTVEKGQKLLSLEAMKMETTIVAERDGIIKEVFVKPAQRVETGDLLLTWE